MEQSFFGGPFCLYEGSLKGRYLHCPRAESSVPFIPIKGLDQLQAFTSISSLGALQPSGTLKYSSFVLEVCIYFYLLL